MKILKIFSKLCKIESIWNWDSKTLYFHVYLNTGSCTQTLTFSHALSLVKHFLLFNGPNCWSMTILHLCLVCKSKTSVLIILILLHLFYTFKLCSIIYQTTSQKLKYHFTEHIFFFINVHHVLLYTFTTWTLNFVDIIY